MNTNSTIILGIVFLILIYTLYFTYNNDFGMFLFIILLLTTSLFVYEYINERINIVTEKIDGTVQQINTLKNNLISALNMNR
jgi:hypothetical protein